jgi:hypothetical protein
MATALITAGASIIGGAITSSATNKAAKRAQAAADANTALQREQYDQSSARLSPYIERGGTADQRIAAFLGLGGDEAASKKAFQDFLDSTGYQFQLGEGTKAIAARQATRGMLNSGATLKALNTYGQNTARTYSGQYLGQLNEQASRGLNAAGMLSGAGANYANAASQNNNAAASAAGNASIAQASSLNSMLGSALGAYGSIAGQSAYDKPKPKF